MNTSLLRPLAAAIALLFVAAACASDTGAEWTFAPVAIVVESDSDETTEEAIVDVQTGDTAETADETEPPAVEEPPQAAEEPPPDAEATESTAPDAGNGTARPRVIGLVADGALRFTTPEGEQLTDIPVTPGETVLFEVDNTAGFPHNFYIGEMSELSVPSGATDVGIPDWSTGIQTVEWVVPDDISALQFACTVPGHYALMQGTFSIADGVEAPAVVVEVEASEAPAVVVEVEASEAPAVVVEVEASEAPAVVVEVEASEAPAVVVEVEAGATGGEARVIDVIADGALRFMTPEGVQLTDIPVTPGESVVFRVDNTAGFPHNFYIGEESEVSVPAGITDTGIPDWETGVQELEWVVPDDISTLQFACTVPGHYALMKGTFSVSP